MAEVQAEWEEAEVQRKRAGEEAACEAEKAAQPTQPTLDDEEEVEISEEEAFELLFDKRAPIPAPKDLPDIPELEPLTPAQEEEWPNIPGPGMSIKGQPLPELVCLQMPRHMDAEQQKNLGFWTKVATCNYAAFGHEHPWRKSFHPDKALPEPVFALKSEAGPQADGETEENSETEASPEKKLRQPREYKFEDYQDVDMKEATRLARLMFSYEDVADGLRVSTYHLTCALRAHGLPPRRWLRQQHVLAQADLREQQLASSDKGSVPMQIHLGKAYMGQGKPAPARGCGCCPKCGAQAKKRSCVSKAYNTTQSTVHPMQ